LAQNKFRFFEIHGVSAQTTGVEPVQNFANKVGKFCVDVFYELLCWWRRHFFAV